jgi:hypothetical protein
MSLRERKHVAALRTAIVETAGELDPDVRRRILEGHATGGELDRYTDKVRNAAWEIEDEDVETLKRAGVGEDAIYEATLAAALGAGLSRLERALGALSRTCETKGEEGCA